MHAPEYTARIKSLLSARGAAEESMKRIVFQFRNGRRPGDEDIADARREWAAALSIVDPNDAALRVLLVDQLKELRKEIGSEDNSDYDELIAARKALNTALTLLGTESVN